MAWTAPATAVTGDIITAAFWNTNGRDNLLETAVAKATAIGLPYASGVNALSLLAAAGNGGKAIRFNAGATALEAVFMTDAASSLEWANKITDLYTALFGADASGTEAGLTGVVALNGAGWAQSGVGLGGGTGSTAAAGDMDAAGDDEPGYIYISGATGYLFSPRIIGGRRMLQALAAILGKTITTITVGTMIKADVTTADAGDGIGISNDSDAAVGAAGVIAIINGVTNFEYRNGAAAAVSLAVAKDTSWHKVEYVITVAAMTMDIEIDDTVRADNVALAQDEWPKGVWMTCLNNVVNWQMSGCWVKFE